MASDSNNPERSSVEQQYLPPVIGATLSSGERRMTMCRSGKNSLIAGYFK